MSLKCHLSNSNYKFLHLAIDEPALIYTFAWDIIVCTELVYVVEYGQEVNSLETKATQNSTYKGTHILFHRDLPCVAAWHSGL